MERKQLPSSFPETFNDFFTLINEDNDHIDLLTNFLEDKVIPHNKENNQLNNVNKRSNSFNTKSKINHSNYNNCNIRKYTTNNNNNNNNNNSNNNNNNNYNNKKFIYNNNNNYNNNNSYSIYSNYSYDNIKKSPINIKKFRSIDKMNLPSCSSTQQTVKCKKKFTKEIPTTSTYIEDDDDDDENDDDDNDDDDEDDDDNDFINSINCYDKKMLGLGDNNKETIKQSHSSVNELYRNNIMKMMMNSKSNENVASTSTLPTAKASTSAAAINTPNKFNTKQNNKCNNDMIKNRLRTASMPVENRKPRLADTRRGAIHYSDMDDIEYYRLRSFSITSHGICNLGDSMRKRRSCSINSGTSSTGTINSDNMKQLKQQITDHEEQQQQLNNNSENNVKNVYKVAMLGASGVGKTALTIQFTTSEYICAYDLSLDDDYGQKTVSVLLNGNETNLEIIDHPECEMSVESFLSTYIIDIFVIVYSIIDRKTFKFAEKIINYLYDNNLMLTHGVILVGNKIDLERQREITQQNGKLLAKKFLCKFIETSSGLNHNVDELLVGIVAQVKLNKKRLINLTEKQRLNINKMNYIKKHQRDIAADGLCHDDSDKDDSDDDGAAAAAVNYCDDDNDDDDDDDDNNGACTSSTNKTYTNITKYDNNKDNNFINFTKRKSSTKLAQELAQMKTATAASSKTSKKLTTTNNTGNNCTTKLTNKTKLFLTTFMKFKNVLNVNRRNSNSCSDLFVI